jgi:hypothetical protein
MYYENIVVSILENNGKAFREFDSERLPNGRKSKVYVPFESEYRILIKNNLDKRIKLSIDIDGTNVSGNGLILDKNSSDTIERFIDVPKKFKFVRANHEGVADPTSKDNGNVKIRIEQEVQPFIDNHFGPWKKYVVPPKNPYNPWPNRPYEPMRYSSKTFRGPSLGVSSRGLDDSTMLCSINCCSSPNNLSVSSDIAGATVEGNNSNQTFGTTHWNGSESFVYEFLFKLVGKGELSEEEQREYKKYLELKKKFG